MQQFHPGQHYYVGGQTKFYGAILFRLREADFGEVRHPAASRPRGRLPTSAPFGLRSSAGTSRCSRTRTCSGSRRTAPDRP